MAGHGEQQPRVLGGHEVELGQVVSDLRLQVVQSEQGRVRLSNWTALGQCRFQASSLLGCLPYHLAFYQLIDTSHHSYF